MKRAYWFIPASALLFVLFLFSGAELAMSQSAPSITQPANGATVSTPVTITWSGAVSPYYYSVWKAPTGSSTWSSVSGCVDLSYTTTQCTDSGASGSVSYTVSACSGTNSSGSCSGSSMISVTVGGGTSPSPSPSPTPSPSPSPSPAPSAPTITVPTSSVLPVNIFWNAPTYASWYNLSRRSPPGSANPWISIGSTLSGTSFSDSGVSVGSSYEYRVNACNSSGCSADSNYGSVSVVSTADTQPPSTPTGLSATAISSSQINISWSASTDNVGVAGYKIYRNGVLFYTTSFLSYSDTGASPNTSYNYYVQAYDAAGNISSPSATVSATTPSGTSSNAISGACELRGPNASAPMSSAPNVGYQYAKLPKSGINDIANLRIACTTSDFDNLVQQYCTQNTLSASSAGYQEVVTYTSSGSVSGVGGSDGMGGIYWISRTACPGGSGGGSTDTTPPATPTSPTAIAYSSNNSISLSWNASTDNVGVVGYKVYRNGSYLGSTSATSSYNVNPTQYQDTGFSIYICTTYSYTVAAFDAAGNISAQSSPASATTPCSGATSNPDTQPPTAPTGLSATTVSSSQINLSWVASTDNVGVAGYRIYQNGNLIVTGLSSSTLFFSVTNGLAAGTTYSYTVAASDAGGNLSPQSASVSGTTTASSTSSSPSPTSTQTLSVAGGVCILRDSYTSLPLYSAADLGTGYSKLTKSGINTVSGLQSACSASDFSNLLSSYCTRNSNSVQQEVATFDSYGNPNSTSCGAYGCNYISCPVSTSTSPTPSPTPSPSTSTSSTPTVPSNLSSNLSNSGTVVNLSWQDNSGNETRFEIYRQPPGGNWSYYAQVGTNQNYFSDAGVSAGAYSYQVAACNGTSVNIGCSSGSNIVSAMVGGGSTASSTTVSNTNLPFVDVKVDGMDGTVYRAAPASYTLSWTTSGNPASCTASGTWGGAKSIPSGSQYFTGVTVLATNTYSITCSNSYGSTSDMVSVVVMVQSPTGATSTQTFVSTSTSLTPPAATGGFIQGSVRDSGGQTTVAGVYVHVFTSDFSLNFNAITQSDGSFGISLPAGIYLVEVSPPSARADLIKPSPQSVIVASGATQTIVLQFSAVSKIINGVATFSTGQPVTDAEVGAYSNMTQQWVSGITDGNGNFTLRVSGGIWQVGIRPRNPGAAQWSSPSSFPQVVFLNDASAETQKVSFVIPLQGAQLTIHAKDDSGNIIQNAGIVLDTISASQPPPPGTQLPPAAYRKSDANGLAIFSLQGGTYYVRAFLPPESGYFNPDEQQIYLNAKDTKDISLVFKKRASAVAAVAFQGITKLDDGTLTDAFVWAWSEKGDAVQVHSGSDGVWSVQVAAGRWHVGAGKEVNGTPYKSSELTVDVGSSVAAVEIILAKVGGVLASPVSVTQPSTQQVVAQATDGAKVSIPENAAGSSGSVNLQVTPTIEAPSQAAAKVVSTVYDVSLTNASGTAVTTFQKDIEITIPYSDADLKAQGITADKIVPSYYDESSGTWVKVDSYVIDKDHHAFILHVKHLTRFALIAAADITPPSAPAKVTASASGSGEILISWVNPSSDFDHAKVYRSTTQGDLGKILMNNVVDTQAKDTNVVHGTKYYYTVVAVDPAGNESANGTQVSVVAQGTSSGAGGKLARNLRLGARGDDVKTLQGILVKEGVYPEGIVSGYFGKLTQKAVTSFQEKYSADILAPNGLTQGTGFVGTSTRAKLNGLP